jgi:multimeric flavodoxin WrbA
MSDQRSEGPRVRKGQGSVALEKNEFVRRFEDRFYDPAFEALTEPLEALANTAWDNYEASRKAPRRRAAGEGFANPDYELPVEWLEARARIAAAQKVHDDRTTTSRVLVICGSPRTDESCPGEISKTFRLVKDAERTLSDELGVVVDVLDLSRLTSEYGRVIHPCKGCASTAMPLCHWPCSCYPNHSLGQVNDWMNEIYERWVLAHGVLIVTPVYWYQAPSVLKLMMDRLVCADGGNPDPTTTRLKHPADAKAIELRGWSYPRHLANRAYAVVVHGDAAGVEGLKNALSSWLDDMHLVSAGRLGSLGRYVGYYEPYATSHDALDRDEALAVELRNTARALAATVAAIRRGEFGGREPGVAEPRPK